MKPATSMELAPAFVHQAGEYPSAMGIAAAGNRVLLGTGAGELRGLDLGTGALSFQTQAHEGVLLSLAAHPAEPLVATGGQDKRLLVTHADTGAMIFERPAGDGWAEHVAWSPDGSMLLVSAGKRARLFAKNGDPMLESESLPSTIAGIAWSRDAEQFAVACYGGVHVFSVAARQAVTATTAAPCACSPARRAAFTVSAAATSAAAPPPVITTGSPSARSARARAIRSVMSGPSVMPPT